MNTFESNTIAEQLDALIAEIYKTFDRYYIEDVKGVCTGCCLSRKSKEEILTVPLSELSWDAVYEYLDAAKYDAEHLIPEARYLLPRIIELFTSNEYVRQPPELTFEEQRQVALADATAGPALAHQRLQLGQGRTLLGHHQHPGGIPVQPVGQLQGMPRTQRTQGLDGAEGDAAATVAGHPGGLVQGQQARVLEHDRRLDPLQQARRRGAAIGLGLQPQRRDPHLVPRLQLAIGLDPAAIDPHLAAAHQLVDQAARRAL